MILAISYSKLTAERKRLNQRYLALKDEVKEAEQIRKSVYSILRQEQREHQPRRGRIWNTKRQGGGIDYTYPAVPFYFLLLKSPEKSFLFLIDEMC